MANPSKYLTSWTIEALRDHIREAEDREVYLVGSTNHKKIVETVTVFARGNATSVPAITHAAKFGDVVIHNHPSGLLEPSPADIQVASDLGNNGVGFYIINNAVTDIYVVVEAFAREEIHALPTGEIEQILVPGGLVSQKLPGYEFRAEQLKMIHAICEAFNADKIALIEAGTGVGKSMAYLLPAIFWAVRNNERTVISTNTINLQEQLIKKDIPFLQSVLTFQFKATLVKGRGNYACLRKVDEIRTDFDFFAEEDEIAELTDLLDWAKHSKDGSKADLNFVPKAKVWDKIAAESDTCTRTKCPHYGACFVNRARREALNSDILVVNHHLLFADLAVRQANAESGILPAYQRIIIDEAHHIEDIATNYFGAGITYMGLNRMLGRLHRTSKGKVKGLLHVLLMKTDQARLPQESATRIYQLIQTSLIPEIEELGMHVENTMESIYNIVKQKDENEFGESKLRLLEGIRLNPEWKNSVLNPAENLIAALRLFATKATKLIHFIESIDALKDEKLFSLTVEINAQVARLEEAANTIEQVLFNNSEDVIRWVEAVTRYNWHLVRLQSSPLEIAVLMKNNIYDVFKTIIMTSATLTVSGIPNRNQFDYLENRIGLSLVERTRRIELVLPAPFNYRDQAVILVPLDVPLPNDRNFSASIREMIYQSLIISQGRAFVLFTAYGLLNLLFNQLEEPLRQRGILPLKQGTTTRHQLLERFRQNSNAALFATDSFWEGVDVQGRALESVIITKLPFKVPTEPVIEARVESIEKQGRNAFMEYTVPQATIKFKQGFGRLIRSKTDRGSVIIFDKRVIEKDYGKIFIKSLPDCRVVTGNSTTVLAELQQFFQSRKE